MRVEGLHEKAGSALHVRPAGRQLQESREDYATPTCAVRYHSTIFFRPSPSDPLGADRAALAQR
jgi:hypothetical protein